MIEGSFDIMPTANNRKPTPTVLAMLAECMRVSKSGSLSNPIVVIRHRIEPMIIKTLVISSVIISHSSFG